MLTYRFPAQRSSITAVNVMLSFGLGPGGLRSLASPSSHIPEKFLASTSTCKSKSSSLGATNMFKTCGPA
jgi:hypothetical protein